MGLSRERPENLQAIFDFGSTFHAGILEPHLVSGTVPWADLALVKRMRDTFFKDQWCREFIMGRDFRREEVFTSEIKVGPYQYKSRCKADGVRLGIKTLLELKGLSVTSKQAFIAAIDAMNYDMAAVHYMLTAGCEWMVIVAISKIKPGLMFKHIIKRHDETWLWGEEKLIQTLKLLHEWSPEDVQRVAA